MIRYRVRSVGLASAAKFGVALGLLASLLPACLTGLLAVRGVAALRQLLEGATQARLTVLGQNMQLNLVEIARLGPTLESLRLLDGLGLALAVTIGLVFLAAASVVTVFTVLLVSVGYNILAALSGGLALELEGETAPSRLTRGGETPAGGQG